MIHGINNCGLVGPETETVYCVTFLWFGDCVMAQWFEAYCRCLNSKLDLFLKEMIYRTSSSPNMFIYSALDKLEMKVVVHI